MTSRLISSTKTYGNDSSDRAGNLVSVIVPCFNAEKTLPKCLDSLLSQKGITPHIICVDDGSTDGTPEILSAYRNNSPHTVSVVSQINSGAWQARIAGLKAANSKFIMFLDSDDYAKPGFVKIMLDEITTSKSDIAVCGFERIDEESNRVLSKEFCTFIDSFNPPEDYGNLLKVNPAPWNKIFKSSILANLPSLKVNPVMLDDLCLLLLAIAHPASKISFVPYSLVEYRVHPDSAINSANIKQVYDAASALKEVRARFLDLGSHALEAFDVIAFCHLFVSMSFRLIETNNRYSNELLAILDSDFPLWRSSKYLSLKYAFSHGKTHIRATLAAYLAKSGLFNLAISTYSTVKKAARKDISW